MRIYSFILLLWLVPPVFADNLWQLYQQAKQNNAGYQAALYQRDADQSTIKIVRSRAYPNLNLSAGLDKVWFSSDQQSTSYNDKLVNLGLRQPLYNRALSASINQAKSLSQQAGLNYNNETQSLIFSVANAYFNILIAQDELHFSKAEKKAILAQHEQATALFEGGIVTISDVYSAQAKADQASATEINAETALEQTKVALAELLGGQPKTAIESLSAQSLLKTANEKTLDAWIKQAFDHSLQIKLAQQQITSAQQQIKIKRAGHYPTLDLVANYRVIRSGRLFSVDNETTSLGIEFALPLYAGGGIQAETYQAQLQFQAAQSNYQQAQNTVERQVRDAYRAVQSSLSQIKAFKTAIASAEKSLEATQNEQQAGVKTSLDVLTEQSILFANRRNYAKARYQNITNFLNLKKVVGVLSEMDIQNLK